MNQFTFLLGFALLCSTGAASQENVENAQWYNKLPGCPCTNPDLNGVRLNDGWAKDKGDINKYHKGATASYRSYPAVKTTAGKSGQQCCYDSVGLLITSGQAAGTPDKVSTCKGENRKGVMKLRLFGILGHVKKDVRPWKKYMKENEGGWQKYNAQWKPNNGNNCNENPL